MRGLRTLIGAALLLAAAVPARAGEPTPAPRPSSEARVPNAFGTTGVLTIPSAYTQGDRVITPYIFGSSRFWGGGIVGGIGRRFEAGFMVLDPDDDFGGGTEFLLNAKYTVLEESRKWPAIAVGVTDALDEIADDPSWYVVLSKYFTRTEIEQNFALKGHFGFGGGLYDEEPFFGVELFFNRYLSAIADFANGDFNIGGRWTSRGFALTLGLYDLDRFGGSISYSWRF